MFAIQPTHIIIIIVVAVILIFGGSRLPEIGRSLGKAINEFRKGTKEAAEGFKEEVAKTSDGAATPAPAPSPATTQPATPPGNFCIQCGAPNPPEARFCAACGTKLPEKVA
ncbi:MAG: twin-arginine translocase TatA/TatE family subunit [Anaerolineales bacterium]